MKISGKVSARTTNVKSVMNKRVKTWFRNEFKFSFASIILGTSDWASAPSPKKLLKTFGILKITTKISCAELAPNKEVKTRSLT